MDVTASLNEMGGLHACVAAIAAVALLLPALATEATAADDPLTPEERAFAEAGPIRIAMGAEPPAGIVLNGTVTGGWATELVELAALKVGVDVEFVPASSAADVVALLANGSVDLAGPLAARPDLAAFAPTSPFSWTPIMFVTHDGHDDLRSADDLAGLRVSTIEGSRAERWLLDHAPDVVYVRTSNVTDGISRLSARDLDAYLGPLGLIGYQVQQAGHRNVRPLGEPVELNTIHFWGAPGGLPLAVLEKGRVRITPQELGLIHVKWTGFNLGPPPELATFAMPLWAMAAAAAVSGLVLVLAAGTVLLRRQVAARTEALQREREGLEREVAQRTYALQQTNADLEAFARTVGHDLRAPLRAIDAYANDLLEDHSDDLDQNARDHVTRIQEAAGRTTNLLDALLLLSRATSTPPDVRRVDLTQLANDARRDIVADDPHRKVRWEIQPGLQAQGDPKLLAIAVMNLLANAWKYTSRKSDAVITFTGRKEPDRLVFEVRDNGAGFDPRHATRLWEPFQRLHPDREFSGSGIGLATVKRIIARHGGEVSAEGEPNNGATFRFALPDRRARNDIAGAGAK